ncbi:MAG: PilZ domain-containing protein [Sphingomonadales bacterium]|nr:PilZ domain-containing protein [Sphingomonadales bacterium]
MQFCETEQDTPFIRAKCRMKTGMVAEVRVLDLSIAGCMIAREALSFELGGRVLVRLPGLEYMPSKVLWVENGLVGIEFERDLHDAVYENLIRTIRPAKAA